MASLMDVVPAAIGLGCGIVALAYMLGRFLQSEHIKSWSRSELAELAFSAILIILVAGILSNPEQVIKAVTGVSISPGATVQFVEARMYRYMEQPMNDILDAITYSSFHLSQITGYNFNYQLPIPYASPTGSSSPGAGAGVLQSAVMLGMDSLSLNLLLVRAVEVIFVFLSFVFAVFLLPAGIILRFIPPTRKLGSTLLAIGLAVQVVFPIAVFWSTELLASAVPTGYNHRLIIQEPASPPALSIVCSPVLSALYGLGEQIISWVVAGIVCLPALPFGGYVGCVGKPGQASPPTDGFAVARVVSYITWLVQYGFPVVMTNSLKNSGDAIASPAALSGAYDALINYVMPEAMTRGVAILFMVVLELACTIILARQFAQLMGAEGQFYGLSKLV